MAELQNISKVTWRSQLLDAPSAAPHQNWPIICYCDNGRTSTSFYADCLYNWNSCPTANDCNSWFSWAVHRFFRRFCRGDLGTGHFFSQNLALSKATVVLTTRVVHSNSQDRLTFLLIVSTKGLSPKQQMLMFFLTRHGSWHNQRHPRPSQSDCVAQGRRDLAESTISKPSLASKGRPYLKPKPHDLTAETGARQPDLKIAWDGLSELPWCQISLCPRHFAEIRG